MKAVIISIGKEILTGRILDSNSNYIAKRLSQLGHNIIRISQIDDRLDDIVWEIKYSLSFNPNLIITTGGLGPTFDDITLKAISSAFGLSFTLNREALEMVKKRYKSLKESGKIGDDSLTPEREKMAYMPAGAQPLFNEVGAAPGMLLNIGDRKIFSFPGVPAEMKFLFEKFLINSLKHENLYVERFFRSKLNDESKLNKYLTEIKNRYSGIYIKSNPKTFGKDIKIEIVVGIRGKTEKDIEKKFNTVINDLKDILI